MKLLFRTPEYYVCKKFKIVPFWRYWGPKKNDFREEPNRLNPDTKEKLKILDDWKKAKLFERVQCAWVTTAANLVDLFPCLDGFIGQSDNYSSKRFSALVVTLQTCCFKPRFTYSVWRTKPKFSNFKFSHIFQSNF